jgi:hypothetical protein
MALTHIAEGSRRLGIDLYSHPLLKKMYLLAFDYQMSDGSLPRFGDAVQDSPNRPSVNEFAYAVYKDQRLIPTLPAKPSFDSVMLGRDASKTVTATLPTQSTLMKVAGHAMLRTNGPGKLTAAMTFGPYGGFHGHYDKNSFVFFGHGEELAVDPGRAASQAYRLPIHRDWYKATAGHNAILVDGKGQNAANGKLLSFTEGKDFVAVAADAGKAYKDKEKDADKDEEGDKVRVTHKRLLVLTDTYLLVVDELESQDGKEHVFDWVYHNKGTGVKCELRVGKGSLGDNPSYKYLQDVKAYEAVGGNGRVTISGDKVDTYVVTHLEPEDQVFTANGPLKSVEDRTPAMVLRRKGKSVKFANVIHPVRKGEAATVWEVMSRGNEVSIGRQGDTAKPPAGLQTGDVVGTWWDTYTDLFTAEPKVKSEHTFRK